MKITYPIPKETKEDASDKFGNIMFYIAEITWNTILPMAFLSVSSIFKNPYILIFAIFPIIFRVRK